jgi:hypothetical protein
MVFAHENTTGGDDAVKNCSLTPIRAGVRLNQTALFTDAQDWEGDMYAQVYLAGEHTTLRGHLPILWQYEVRRTHKKH